MSSFSPFTIWIPRLTLVSLGNPRRRFDIGSKAKAFELVEVVVIELIVIHDKPPGVLNARQVYRLVHNYLRCRTQRPTEKRLVSSQHLFPKSPRPLRNRLEMPFDMFWLSQVPLRITFTPIQAAAQTAGRTFLPPAAPIARLTAAKSRLSFASSETVLPRAPYFVKIGKLPLDKNYGTSRVVAIRFESASFPRKISSRLSPRKGDFANYAKLPQSRSITLAAGETVRLTCAQFARNAQQPLPSTTQISFQPRRSRCL